MGRRSKSRVLTVWMNGECVGEWRRPIAGGQEFVYVESWLTSPAARPISLSMPLRPSREPYRNGVEMFFENLLPDNRQIRERIQRRFQTTSIRAFDLLQEIGRDCVGALQLVPEGEKPINIQQITGDRLTPEEVGKLFAGSLGTTFAGRERATDAFRISLAGAQEKTALLLHNGTWRIPTHTTPTTHILKLPLGLNPQNIDLSTSVENEWLCAQIVHGYGIEVAKCQIEMFGEYKTLVVERFDRRLAPGGGWYLRLPQEDFCQATATPSALKYESEGGPGIGKIMNLLLGSERAEKDREDFMRTQVVYWMLVAIDGHAKNYSLFLLPGSNYRLTPRYDILSAHPVLGHGKGKLAPEKIRMAMAAYGKNRHYRWKEIQARHWVETGKRCGFNGMKLVLEDLIARTPNVLDHVRGSLPAGFPEHIANTILGGTQFAAQQLTRATLSK
jgi:serine/threonine-protein kinase HipA